MNLTGEEQTKWDFLDTVPAEDAKNDKLREIAEYLWAASGHRKRWFAELAHALVRDCIRYQTDGSRVGGEDIAGYTRDPMPDDAVDAYERGADDCDAKARMFVALCLAVGIPAEMVGFEKDGELVHVAARCLIDGEWQHVETTLRRARLGELHTDVPHEANGKWRTN